MYTYYLQFNLTNIKKYPIQFSKAQSNSALQFSSQKVDVFEHNIHFGGKPTPILDQNPALRAIIEAMADKNLRKDKLDEASLQKAKEAVYRAAQTYAALKKAKVPPTDSWYTKLTAPETTQALNLDALDMTAEDVRSYMEEVGRECVNYAAQCGRSRDSSGEKSKTAERLKSYLKVTPNQKEKTASKKRRDKNARKEESLKKRSKIIKLKLPQGASHLTSGTDAESEFQQNITTATLASQRTLRTRTVKPGAYTVDSVPLDAFEEAEDSSNDTSDNDLSDLSTIASLDEEDEIEVSLPVDPEEQADDLDAPASDDDGTAQGLVPRKPSEAVLKSKAEKDALLNRFSAEKEALERRGESIKGLQADFLRRVNAERKANNLRDIPKGSLSRWLGKLPDQEIGVASNSILTESASSYQEETPAQPLFNDEVELGNASSQKEYNPMPASAPEIISGLRTFAKSTSRSSLQNAARPAADMMPTAMMAVPGAEMMQSSVGNQFNFRDEDAYTARSTENMTSAAMIPASSAQGKRSAVNNQFNLMGEDGFYMQAQAAPPQHRAQPTQPFFPDVNTNNWVQEGIKAQQSKRKQQIRDYFQRLNNYVQQYFPQEPEKQALYTHTVKTQVKAFFQQSQPLAPPVQRQLMQTELSVPRSEASTFSDSLENFDFTIGGTFQETVNMPPPPAPTKSHHKGTNEQVKQWQAGLMAQPSEPQTPSIDEDAQSCTTGTTRMGDLDITSRGSSTVPSRKRPMSSMSQYTVSSTSSNTKTIKPKDLAGFYRFAKKDEEAEEFFVKKMIRTLIKKLGFEDKLSTDLKDIDIDIDDESIFSTLDEDHAEEVNRLLPLPEKPTLSQRTYLESLKKKLPAAILNNKRPRVVINQEEQI